MKEYFCDITTVSKEEFELWYHQMEPSRQKKCKQLKNETAQKQCIAADHLARTALSEHMHLPPEDIPVSRSASGKPYVEGNPIYFSISHSERKVICAVSEFPVGIDIERIRPVPAARQERICTPEELKYLRSSKDGTQRNLRFLYLWTRKEAVFKIEGRLPRQDNKIDVATVPAGWKVETRTEDGFMISVAIRQKL